MTLEIDSALMVYYHMRSILDMAVLEEESVNIESRAKQVNSTTESLEFTISLIMKLISKGKRTN